MVEPAIPENQAKPMDCDVCGEHFPSKGAMRKHQGKKHPEEMKNRNEAAMAAVGRFDFNGERFSDEALEFLKLNPEVAQKFFELQTTMKEAWTTYESNLPSAVTVGEGRVNAFLKNFIRERSDSKEIKAALQRGETHFQGKRIIAASADSPEPYVQKCPRACITAVWDGDPIRFAEEWDEKGGYPVFDSPTDSPSDEFEKQLDKAEQRLENPRGLDLTGRLFGGDLVVREKYDQAPYDSSWIWLVENTTTGKAELWRSCDLTRIERKGERINNTKYFGYNEYSHKNQMPLRLEDAQKRLDEIKKSEFKETFYVIRRKSDGLYLFTRGFEPWDGRTTDENPMAVYRPQSFQRCDYADNSAAWKANGLLRQIAAEKERWEELPRSEWEWVKVETTYRLTVETT